MSRAAQSVRQKGKAAAASGVPEVAGTREKLLQG